MLIGMLVWWLAKGRPFLPSMTHGQDIAYGGRGFFFFFTLMIRTSEEPVQVEVTAESSR